MRWKYFDLHRSIKVIFHGNLTDVKLPEGAVVNLSHRNLKRVNWLNSSYRKLFHRMSKLSRVSFFLSFFLRLSLIKMRINIWIVNCPNNSLRHLQTHHFVVMTFRRHRLTVLNLHKPIRFPIIRHKHGKHDLNVFCLSQSLERKEDKLNATRNISHPANPVGERRKKAEISSAGGSSDAIKRKIAEKPFLGWLKKCCSIV